MHIHHLSHCSKTKRILFTWIIIKQFAVLLDRKMNKYIVIMERYSPSNGADSV
uniref:Uncharacterized protein n=1 Tax=Rhizophora mucronata TaxID=61149 RepID=A0A2P2IUI9_RHIMU